jgi:hypothetical protein
MQKALLKKKIAFSKKQIQEIEEFKEELAKGNVEFAFEGSLLEGKAFLQGAIDIVETLNH